ERPKVSIIKYSLSSNCMSANTCMAPKMQPSTDSSNSLLYHEPRSTGCTAVNTLRNMGEMMRDQNELVLGAELPNSEPSSRLRADCKVELLFAITQLCTRLRSTSRFHRH